MKLLWSSVAARYWGLMSLGLSAVSVLLISLGLLYSPLLLYMAVGFVMWAGVCAVVSIYDERRVTSPSPRGS
jgi:hypothetical protein